MQTPRSGRCLPAPANEKEKDLFRVSYQRLKPETPETESSARLQLSSSELKQVAFDLLECFPLAFFAISPDFHIRFSYGKAFDASSTRSPQRIQGESILDYFSDRPDILAPIKKALRTRKALSVRATWKGRFYSAHYFPFFQSGVFEGLHCYVFDHEEAHPLRPQVSPQAKRNKDLIGHFVLNSTGQLESFNQELLLLTGYEKSELEACGVATLFSSPHKDMGSLEKSERQSIVDCSMRTKSGQFLPVRLQMGPLPIGSEVYQSYHVRSLQHDWDRELVLDETERRFRSFAESAPLFLAITDDFGKLTYFNSQWLSFRGRTLDEECLTPWTDALSPLDRKRYCYALRKAIKQKIPFHFESAVRRSDKAERWVYWKAAPRFHRNGQFAGFVYSGLDITKQKKTYEGLRKSKIKLERSNAELTQFAYAASHDLQEPLRTINSFADLLATEYGHHFDDEAKQYFSYITDSAKRMRELINDILAYSRITHSDEDFRMTSLNDCLDEAMDLLKEKIRDSNSLILVKGDLGNIDANYRQMVQVFQNLIDNAIKYRGSEQARIEIESKVKNDQIILSVRDYGIGIDPKFREKVFQLFQRLHTREDFDGNGIGLSLVKKIVEFHNGEAWFDPEIAKGTCLSMALPLRHQS